jgi:hypothetical protein
MRKARGQLTTAPSNQWSRSTMFQPQRKRFALALLAALSLASGVASAANTAATFCIFDPVGAQGDAFSLAKDQALVAKTWGVDITLKPYTDEGVVAEDFKAGQCDGIAVTTLRVRQFNPFTGSIDSIGGVPSEKHIRALINALASPKMASHMINGPYEVVGIIPLGGVYVMVRDRNINSIEKAAGKKIAVLEWDKSEAKMVQQLGAQPVASDITNFAGKFNNGQVDIVAAPAVAYKPLELYKGIGTAGGIFRFPLIEMTASMIIHRDKFPEGFGQKCREYVAGQMDKAFTMINKSEKDIPAKQWMDLTPADKDKYTRIMRESRMQLTSEGIYDKNMMHVLKNLRCKLDSGAAECSQGDE